MKILIVADEPGWIFERHALEIQKRITEHQIDIAFRKQDIPRMSKKYDLVYIMDPIPLKYGYPPQEKCIMGLRCQFLYEEHPKGARGLYEDGFPGRCVSIKDKCNAFHVVNKGQMEAFKDVVTDKPLMLAQHGIDETLFNRSKYERTKNDVLTVGVAGRLTRQKGANIITKACELAGVNLLYTDYRKRLTKEKMPQFYARLDAYVCMSATEGLNNPVMEAGAMGLPVISSDCGAIREMVDHGTSGFIVKRKPESVAEAMEKLKDENFRVNMGEEFHKEIMKIWTWKQKIEDFRKMFNEFGIS